jgi:hypothetical protein
MDFYIQCFLTEADKLQKVFGCKNKLFFEKIMLKLQDDLDDLDSEHEGLISFTKNAKSVLLDIINGKAQFADLHFMYVMIYEKLCGVFGQQIYCPSDEFSVAYFTSLQLAPSALIPIPLATPTPFIYSIAVANLATEKTTFLTASKPASLSDKEFAEQQADYAYAFDQAIKQNKDLVFSMY